MFASNLLIFAVSYRNHLWTMGRSTPEQQGWYRTAMKEALLAGHEILESGGEAMDAAVAAVSYMEGSLILVSGASI